jgi:hypothetical protein
MPNIVKPPPEPPGLLSKPQLLGILPTWWFWGDPENWELVARPLMPIYVVTTMVALFVMPHPMLALIAPTAVLVLLLGVLERYIRRQVRKRRELTE